ncbi:DMT family transporter [Tepidibacter aestuarii]|uniref:DMT family transporter n=1 Tax=Tepidibacter aestuarii TaxID=2925782 RepID=UPI0020BE0A45|nr:DMT family transporter [Tepidibacter aestuarii]
MKPYVKLIVSMLIFGSIGIFVKNIPLESVEIVVCRTIIGSCFLFFMMFVSKNKINTKQVISNVVPLLISGLVLGLNWLFLFEAYSYTSVSVATLLYYCAPIIVMLLSPFVLKESLQSNKIIGIVVSMIGMILVNQVHSASRQELLGVGYGLLAALFYAILILANKHIKKMSSLETTVIQLVIATIVLIPYAVHSHQGEWIIPTGISLLALCILGFVHTGIACLLYFSSMKDLPGQSVALCSYIDPLSALIFSAIFLHEHLTFVQIVGAILILSGAIFGEVYIKNKSQSESIADQSEVSNKGMPSS